jgi:hypothetical protein
MKATGNPIANFDRLTPSPIAATSPAPSDSGTTPILVERARADPHHDLLHPGLQILARPQHDAVNGAEAVDVAGFIFSR